MQFQNYLSRMFKIPSPVEAVEFDGLHFHVKRDDLIHPEVSGNKWRKLRLNIAAVQESNAAGILTFGGAFSNHIAATAAAGRILGLKTIGIIRGEPQYAQNHTLRKASADGMELHFISRSEYKSLRDENLFDSYSLRFPGFKVIPEGGANLDGAQGCADFWDELEEIPEHVVLAGGTGTTAAGLLMRCPDGVQIHLVPVLKGGDYLHKPILALLKEGGFGQKLLTHLTIHPQFHGGGYAKTNSALSAFKPRFETETQIKLDHVYTAKSAFASAELMRKGILPPEGGTLFIHTGGLQGNKSEPD